MKEKWHLETEALVETVAVLAVRVKCTMQFAQIVARKHRFRSSRAETGQCTVASVTRNTDQREASKN